MALWLFLSILLTQGPIPRLDSGVVTGVVRLPDGKPAVGVRVAAMVPPDAGFNPGSASELTAIGKTDEAGRYRLEEVPVGRYYIVAGRVDAPTYYPGVSGMSGATALSVTAGASLADIDFVISPESARAPERTDPFRLLGNIFVLGSGPSMQAAGRVVMDARSPDQKLPPWITLNARIDGYASPFGGPTLMTAGSYAIKSSVASNGLFSINLQPGESTISIHGLPEGYSVKSITSGAMDLLQQPLKVQAGMAEIVVVLTADLRPRFTVEGRVTSAAANRSLMGEQIELHGDSALIARVILDAEGQFAFRKLLPGNYRLRLASSALSLGEKPIVITDQHLTGVEF